jgi:hypothetical protein
MKKVLFVIFVFSFAFVGFGSRVLAADDFGIGTIDVPPGVKEYQTAAQAKTGADIGIIYFVSNLIKIFAAVAGVWTLFNITLAGYMYLSSSGDAGTHQKVQTQVTNSVIGLILIVLSFTFGGLIGFIFFGDAGFILNPSLTN